MKLLQVMSSCNPAVGGPVEAVRQLALELEHSEHTVEIVCTDEPGASWFTQFPCPVTALGGRFDSYGYCPEMVPWLQQHAAQFDAVVVRGIWRYHSFAVWRALRHSQTPYFVFTHGMLDPWFKQHYPLKHLKKWLYWPWAEYRVLRDAAAVLFTSEEERRLARESFWLYRCTEHVVRYGTAGPDCAADEAKTELYQRFPELRGKQFLLFMGRIHTKKGCDLLLEAFAETNGPDGERLLVFAGPDQLGMQKALHQRAAELGVADRVVWTGMLQGKCKWGALFAAEVFCLPSHQENFGVAAAEALACGVPVLLSDKVNIYREIVGAGAGFAGADTLEGTIQLLEKWCGLTAAERTEMAASALACHQQFFSIQQAASSLLEAVKQHGSKG